MNQDEINTNAAAGAAASAAATVVTTAKAVVKTRAAAEAAAPAAAFVLVSDWFLTGFRLVFRLYRGVTMHDVEKEFCCGVRGRLSTELAAYRFTVALLNFESKNTY